MEADLMTSTNFYFLNQNFEVIHKLTQYESLMWVDKYDEPGSFEIYAPPLPEIKEAAQINNYFMSDKSEHMMIVEKLETTVSPDDGKRLIISGRSLESILDRRVLFMKCYFRDKNSSASSTSATTVGADNLEDAVRQLLEYLFISPTHWDNDTGTWVPALDRVVPNFDFAYTEELEQIRDSDNLVLLDSNEEPIFGDDLSEKRINQYNLKDCEFDKGENALNIVNTIVKQAGLGYKITLDTSLHFVFTLIKGRDRTSSQYANPAVIFSPTFNNLKSSKFTSDYGENFRNFVYTEGEVYKSKKPTIVETGEATGLLRREVYVTSEVQHETESSNVTHEGITKEKKKLTEEEYQTALAEDAEKYYKKYASKITLESEIEPRLTFQYGRDFNIGDILEVQDGTGNSGKVRCKEFIISHSSNGYEEYPTFEAVTDEEESPAQTSASGGEFSEENNSKLKLDVLELCYPVGSFYTSTKNVSPETFLGGTWEPRSGYMLRASTTNVTFDKENDTEDGGSDDAFLRSHTHTFTGSAVNSGYVSSDHSHNMRSYCDYNGTGGGNRVFAYSYSSSVATPNTGGISANHYHSVIAAGSNSKTGDGDDGTGKNLPKYKNVYMWERVA